MQFDLEDFPLLGEPFAVEFANTRYVTPSDSVDFLDSREAVVAWFDHVANGLITPLPRNVDVSGAQSIRALRDSMHDIFESVTTGRQPARAEVAMLNQFANAVGCRVELDWPSDKAPNLTTAPTGRGIAATISQIALECITFLASPSLACVRQCEGQDCPMFFVKQHHKRRFCFDGCSHRARQARYYRSLHP